MIFFYVLPVCIPGVVTAGKIAGDVLTAGEVNYSRTVKMLDFLKFSPIWGLYFLMLMYINLLANMTSKLKK